MAVAGAVLAAVAACTGSHGSSPPGPPTVAEARAVLGHYAAAVRRGSPRAMLAVVDTAPTSAAFRARQAAAAANLARLPLRAWQYRSDGPVRDAAILAQARRRYGTPVRILHVTLGYALRGVDPVPDRHDQWLTFVRRDGHVLLAGDDDLADHDAPSWAGPWQFGPLAVVHGRASLVLGPAAQRARLVHLAGVVDAAVPAVTRVWGTGWTRQVAVIDPSTSQEFTELAGTGGATESLEDVSAVATDSGIDPVSGRPTGQRLVLNPAALHRLSRVGQGIVVRHEVTHLATAAVTSADTPRWLAEGFAEYVANRGTGQPVRTAAAELRRAIRAGSVPAHLPGERAFARSGAALARAYEESWLACRLLAKRVGQAGLVRFYREVGTALAPAGPALRHALRATVHETPQGFTARWRAYLRAQLA